MTDTKQGIHSTFSTGHTAVAEQDIQQLQNSTQQIQHRTNSSCRTGHTAVAEQYTAVSAQDIQQIQDSTRGSMQQ